MRGLLAFHAICIEGLGLQEMDTRRFHPVHLDIGHAQMQVGRRVIRVETQGGQQISLRQPGDIRGQIRPAKQIVGGGIVRAEGQHLLRGRDAHILHPKRILRAEQRQHAPVRHIAGRKFGCALISGQRGRQVTGKNVGITQRGLKGGILRLDGRRPLELCQRLLRLILAFPIQTRQRADSGRERIQRFRLLDLPASILTEMLFRLPKPGPRLGVPRVRVDSALEHLSRQQPFADESQPAASHHQTTRLILLQRCEIERRTHRLHGGIVGLIQLCRVHQCRQSVIRIKNGKEQT